MNNINLMYAGGSGGFFLLHLLLLSGKYMSVFPPGWTVQSIVQHQWAIVNADCWKDNEIMPINPLTEQAHTDLNKIYFYCNPHLYHKIYSATNVVLYTDFDSQQKLCLYKKSNRFLNHRSVYVNQKIFEYRQLIQQWRNYYQAVRDPSWPACPSIKQFYTLPDYIQKELLNGPDVTHYINKDYRGLNTENYAGQAVDKNIVDYLKNARLAICLQDLVNSRAQILVDQGLITEINSQQLELIDRWRSLHPTQLLNHIGIR